MTKVRAFVGHSFTQDDDFVVSKFLNFFEALESTNIGFTWDHAKTAEAKDLAEKVLQKIEGKNTFIAICTKKEATLRQHKKGKFWPLTHSIFAKESDIEWKASDWITQEIGLAVGRQLKIILLIENGVRNPGGLTGNIQYIEFERDSPEKCFSSIMEMIASLSPPPSLELTSAEEKEAPHEKTPAPKIENKDKWSNPTPEWDHNDYELAMLLAIGDKNKETEKSIDKAYREKYAKDDNDTIPTWNGYCEYMRVLFGDQAIVNLSQIAKQHPDNAKIQSYLAKAYAKYEDFNKAAQLHKQAAQLTSHTDEKIENLRQCAINLIQAEDRDAANTITDEIRIILSKNGLDINALKVLLTIYAKDDRHKIEIAIQERLIEADPSDAELRFELAYNHSRRGSVELSYYHYTMIEASQRMPMAWNNLGVASGALGMPINSMRAFKKSSELGETLAMGNLALRYLNAGLIEDAQNECEKAEAIPDHHKNIKSVRLRIDKKIEEEEEKNITSTRSAKKRSTFLRRFGEAVLQPMPESVPRSWHHKKYGSLSVTIDGINFTATGSYHKPRNLLALGAKTAQRVDVKIQGTITGKAIDITIEEDDGTPKGVSLLNALGNSSAALMYLTDDESQFIVLEKPFGDDADYYTINCSEP